MIHASTQMLAEIREAPAVVARQLAHAEIYREEGERLRREAPRFVATCARGSSDQAVTFFKYIAEQRLGLPIASVGPSIASVYGAELKFEGGILLTVSQSGGSPDLVSLQERAAKGGARTLALLNVTDSAVGNAAGSVLPMMAGQEKAVAATKSFVASLVALATVVAHWKRRQDPSRRAVSAAGKSGSRRWNAIGRRAHCQWRRPIPCSRSGAGRGLGWQAKLP
ncbi:MAG: SIS domain-containing protein [Rhizobiaceae bacterium]